jgi:hypothetical protein
MILITTSISFFVEFGNVQYGELSCYNFCNTNLHILKLAIVIGFPPFIFTCCEKADLYTLSPLSS